MDINFSDILKKGINSLLIQGTSILITLILNWYLAKTLGAKEYGVFTYAFSWVYLFGSLSMLGLNSVLQREIIRYVPEKTLALIRFSRKVNFIISITITVLFSFIVYLFLPNLDNHLLNALLIAIIALPIFGQLLINKSACIGLKNVELSLISEELVRPVVSLGAVLIIWNIIPPNSLSAIIINILAIAIAFITSLFFVKKSLPKINEKPIHENKQWLRLGFTFFLFTATITINSNADILMLGFFGFTDKVGIYNIALKLSLFISMPLLISNKIIIPYISKYYETKKKELSILLKKVTRLVSLIGIISFLIYLFYSAFILNYFGEEFKIAQFSLIILSCGELVNLFVGPVGNILTMSKFEKTAIKVMIASTVINIVLNLILIPFYDMEGAAIASCVSLSFWNIMLLIFVKRNLNINPTII